MGSDLYILGNERINGGGLLRPLSPMTTSIYMNYALPLFEIFLGKEIKELLGCLKIIDGLYYISVESLSKFLGGRFSDNEIVKFLEDPNSIEKTSFLYRLPIKKMTAIFILGIKLTHLTIKTYREKQKTFSDFEFFIEKYRQMDISCLNFDTVISEINNLAGFNNPASLAVFRMNIASGFDLIFYLLMAITKILFKDENGNYAYALLTNLPDSLSNKVTLELQKLAQLSNSNPKLKQVIEEENFRGFQNFLTTDPSGQNFQIVWNSFIDSFGYRGSQEEDLINPRWAEDPQQVYSILKGYLQNSIHTEKENQKFQPFAGKWNPLYSLIKPVIYYAKWMSVIRDNSRFLLLEQAFFLRQLILRLGDIMTNQGLIDDRENIFYLKIDEISAFEMNRMNPSLPFNISQIVKYRKHRLEEVSLKGPTRIIDLKNHSTIKHFESCDQSKVKMPIGIEKSSSLFKGSSGVNNMILWGSAGSPGKVMGNVLIVPKYNEANWMSQPLDGKIIVASQANPNLSFIFPLIKGIILETGSVMSHVSILAREYQVPLIFNVSNATTLIPDGACVELDTYRGCVVIRG